jgi:hypothetical protein
MFENRDELLSDQDIRLYLDEGHLYLAKYAKEEEKFEEALKLLNQITTPEASFETAVVIHTVCNFQLGVLRFGVRLKLRIWQVVLHKEL